jgi:hypothetical protein
MFTPCLPKVYQKFEQRADHAVRALHDHAVRALHDHAVRALHDHAVGCTIEDAPAYPQGLLKVKVAQRARQEHRPVWH